MTYIPGLDNATLIFLVGALIGLLVGVNVGTVISGMCRAWAQDHPPTNRD